MSDLRSGYDEDSLPWIQEVEDEDAPRGITGRAMGSTSWSAAAVGISRLRLTSRTCFAAPVRSRVAFRGPPPRPLRSLLTMISVGERLGIRRYPSFRGCNNTDCSSIGAPVPY